MGEETNENTLPFHRVALRNPERRNVAVKHETETTIIKSNCRPNEFAVILTLSAHNNHSIVLLDSDPIRLFGRINLKMAASPLACASNQTGH